MKTITREPYRGHYVDYTLYILITACIVLLGCSLLKLAADLQDTNKRLDILAERIEELQLSVQELEIEEQELEEDLPIYYKEAEWPRLYTEEDAIVLTKMLWGEARGIGTYEINGNCVSSKCQQAAVIWTVLNRYDAGYADTIIEVVTAKNQFVGYRASNPVDEELMELVMDVLDRWNKEKHGETEVGRVLPADYMWFRGDGRYNHFRNEYNSTTRWGWNLEDIYG